MSKRTSLVLLLFATVGIVPLSSAQNTHIQLPPAVPQSQDLRVGVPKGDPPSPSVGEIPTSSAEIFKQQAIAANQQRQVEIRRDTAKMAELTKELNDYLMNSQQDSLSVDVMKKAEQIEKLAHSVRSKMKQTF
jgi:hypothetical protein